LIHLCFPDNILVQLEVSRLAPCKQRSMELVGSRKRLLFDDLRQFDKLRLFPADPPPCPDLDANALHRGALPQATSVSLAFGPPSFNRPAAPAPRRTPRPGR